MNNELDTTLAALADPTRRQVVELLRERPRRAGELASACAMSSPAMSRHLRMLRASGLVKVEEDQGTRSFCRFASVARPDAGVVDRPTRVLQGLC